MQKEIYTKIWDVVIQWKGFEWALKVNKERISLDSSLRMGSFPKLCLYKREEKKSGSLVAIACTLLRGSDCLKERRIWLTNDPGEKI